MRQVFRGAVIATCDPGVVRSDLAFEDGVITAVGVVPPKAGDVDHDLTGHWVFPGLIQTHIHLVQTLFRGMADDLPLLPWLQDRIWPLERAHDEESVYWSARLGLTELLLGGTTTILDMATVNHTEQVFRAAEECGMRAAIGKAMMDRDNEAGLGESTDQALSSSCDLADRFHGRGRLRYAFAPRFVPSCTDALLQQTAVEAQKRGCLLHTHASENQDEVALVRKLTGRDNVEHLAELGFLGPETVLAHCIHLTQAEIRILAETGTTVAHCPSSNLKLASGIAPIPTLLEHQVRCTLGADGAPCNNRLDAFAEMRLAALMQKPQHGAEAMDAQTVFQMATKWGAEALGRRGGVLKPGHDADFVIVDPNTPAIMPADDPISAVVYAMTPQAVRDVWIAGDRIVQNGQLLCWSWDETVQGVRGAHQRVRNRAFS